MLVLSIQRDDVIRKIYRREYKPQLLRSRYAMLNSGFSTAYMYIYLTLTDFKGIKESGYSGFYWGWLQNPYFKMHTFDYVMSKCRMVGVFLDVPDDCVVVSDYDRYMEYVEGTVEDFPEVDMKDVSRNACLQVSFLDFNPSSVRCVVPFSRLLKSKEKTIKGIYEEVRLDDESFIYRPSLWLPCAC